jgi:hypothetical protein
MINRMLETDETLFMKQLFRQQADLVSNNPIVYKYINFQSGFKILSQKTLAFRNPSFLNDPYDCNLHLLDFTNIPANYRKNLINHYHADLDRKKRRKMIASSEKVPNQFLSNLVEEGMKMDLGRRGVTSFCEKGNFNNMLMWSHYSSSHTGICIGFKLSELYLSLIKKNPRQERILLKVDYSEKFRSINYFSHPAESIIHWLGTKAPDWSYEKEIRLVLYDLSFDQNGLNIQAIESNCIQEIYLGSKITRENDIEIRALVAKDYPEARIFKMELAPARFELEPN